jgi:hypothetical protein
MLVEPSILTVVPFGTEAGGVNAALGTGVAGSAAGELGALVFAFPIGAGIVVQPPPAKARTATI